MKLGIFVTGTDTDIGKTIVCSLLLASLKSHFIKTGYFKPIQTGLEQDTVKVAHLTGIELAKIPEPVYSFPEPVAPYRASQIHGQQIQLDHIQQQWEKLEEKAWVVEGVGGVMVPLNGKATVRDMILALGLKTVVVATTRLGTMNHTLLTVEAIRAVGVEVAGLILVGEQDPSLEAILSEFCSIPMIVRVPYFSLISPSVIQEEGPKLFPFSTLRMFYD